MPPAAADRYNGLAVASPVCAVVGFFMSWLFVDYLALFGVPSIVAIVMGYASRRQIRRSEGVERGSALATAGIVIGFVSLIVLTVVVFGTAKADLF